jgi:hypothetical protein
VPPIANANICNGAIGAAICAPAIQPTARSRASTAAASTSGPPAGITPVNDINILASQGAVGIYNGHLIGSVFNNGAQYVAAGGLAASYNFATRTGAFAVNNYDGRSFTVSGSPVTQGANYKFAINNVPGISGAINGSFYGPMAAETGGNFAFKTTAGPTYLTSGIFAAKR